MQVNFGRAIKITYNDDGSKRDTRGENANTASKTLVSTMTDRPSSAFDKETSRKIGTFLRAQFSDYTKEAGAYFWKNKHQIYVLTGEEAKKAREANKILEKDLEKAEKKYPKKSRRINSKSYSEKRKHAFAKRDKAINRLLEDGKDGKPNSAINIETNKNGDIKEITYYSTQRTQSGQNTTCEILTL